MGSLGLNSKCISIFDDSENDVAYHIHVVQKRILGLDIALCRYSNICIFLAKFSGTVQETIDDYVN